MAMLDILKAAAAVAEGTVAGQLPPRTIRFALEYAQPPEVSTERGRIADLLKSQTFDLEVLDDELPTFLVLQFPGVERSISTPTLYGMADEIRRQLDLVSCTPDTGVTYPIEAPSDRTIEGRFADPILDRTCWAPEKELPPKWAIESIRAVPAWALSQGRSAIIAQPDTGVATHPELLDALDLSKAFNVLNGSSDPTDPLTDEMGNPGHGTATSSVVASRVGTATKGVTGSAPEALVVPIRCTDSVILGLDGTPVARAIMHAKKIKADVISMSLGGPFYSPATGAAIKEAVAEGAIVLAAAGNCVQPIVVYPASDYNVIAVAGVDIDDRPWKGTSRGRKVDVCAPAENVYVARRQPGDGGVGTVNPSQGTSFATALTAGVAALWVAHHGRAAIRAEAARRTPACTVHELFRAALKATARPPKTGTWDNRKFGAGIVDADALLRLALVDIPAISLSVVDQDDPNEQTEAVNVVMAEAAARRDTGSFDWRRHGAEAVFLATDAWRRADPKFAGLLESRNKPQPTADLVRSMPAVLRRALAPADACPALVQPAVNTAEALNAIRVLGSNGVGGLESAATLEQARKNLRGPGLRKLQDDVEDTFRKLDAEDQSATGRSARSQVLSSTERIVEQLLEEDGPSRFNVEDRAALEAIVKLKGRPALRVDGGTISPADPLFGEWGGTFLMTDKLPLLTSAVGRIDLDGEHIGTGFLVAPNLIMTNRHVLEGIAEEVRGNGVSRWEFAKGSPTIDFSDLADAASKADILKVVAAGPNTISNVVNLSHLDLALMEIATPTSAPTPLTLVGKENATASRSELFTIGYPARPGTSAMIDPKTGQFSQEIANRLGAIFNFQYGRKYICPGLIEATTGTLPDDTNGWVFAHDATTLGGNSGSCVVRLTGEFGVIGLHFAGAPLTANYAHSLAKVRSRGTAFRPDIVGITWV